MMPSKKLVSCVALASVVLLSGCDATMGALTQKAQNAVFAVRSSLTPPAVAKYQAAADRTLDLSSRAAEVMRSQGITPGIEYMNVELRNPIGQSFVINTVRHIRFAVPQDAMDAKAPELGPMVDGLSKHLAAWNASEPIEVAVVSASDNGADAITAMLRSKLPGVNLKQVIGSKTYSGIDVRVQNNSQLRLIK